jgi:DNA ligase (NAD+)
LTTKIISVDHQVGRTGTITPVAKLEPINIWWAMISRATLHNYEEVEQLWVKIWDIVFIKRAWEVIPKIVSVSTSPQPYPRASLSWAKLNSPWSPLQESGLEIKPPKNCPSCWNEIKKDDDKVRFFCDNPNCPAQIVEKLVYAVWKQWFNIDSFWEKQIKKFYELWFIKNLSDIFEIKKFRQEILDLEWFQEKSVNNIINNVEKAKNTDISTLLNSLSIAWVWKKTSKTLSVLFKSQDDLLNFSYTIEDIEKLDDIWPEIAKNIFEFFNNTENKKLLEK